VVMPENLGGAYRHVYELDPVLSAMAPWQVTADGIQSGDISVGQRKVRRGTIAAAREWTAWEWLSVMIDQASWSWSAEAVVGSLALQCVAYSTNLSPTTNTLTTLRKARPNPYPDVLFRQARIRLGPYSTGTALNSTHQLACASASVTLQNQLAATFGPRTGQHPEEYERSGPPIVLGSLQQPRYTSNTLVSAWEANTRYMLEMVFTGPRIAGTAFNYQLTLYVPGLFFTQVEPSPLSVGRSSLPLNWFAAAPDVTPAGFPTTARQGPLILEVISGVAAHGLL